MSQLIRSFPLAHPPGLIRWRPQLSLPAFPSIRRPHHAVFPSMSSIPMNSIVEDLQAALAQFAEIANDLKR